MYYAAQNIDTGAYTGALYRTRDPDMVAHHAALGERLVAVAGLANVGEGENYQFEPVVGDLATTRAVTRQQMLDWIGDFLAPFTAGVPAEEIASWPVKAAAAAQHLAGTPHPIITGEAGLTGEDATDLAQRIAAKAGLYTAIVARVTGLRRATEAAIATAETPEACAVALAAAHVTAQQLIADLGLGQSY